MKEDDNIVDNIVDKLIDFYEKQHNTKITSRLNVLLALEGNFALINKLSRAERKEPGFGTIIVPKKIGFSENDDVHNLVLEWCEYHNINVVDTQLIEAQLELALHTG